MMGGGRRWRRPAAMHAETANAGAAGPPTESRSRAPDWGAVLALQTALSALLAFLTTVIWGLTGHGYFWPMWVWFGLAIPIALQLAVRRALQTPPGRRRGLALHLAVFAVLGPIEVIIWAMTGLGCSGRSGRCSCSPPRSRSTPGW